MNYISATPKYRQIDNTTTTKETKTSQQYDQSFHCIINIFICSISVDLMAKKRLKKSFEVSFLTHGEIPPNMEDNLAESRRYLLGNLAGKNAFTRK